MRILKAETKDTSSGLYYQITLEFRSGDIPPPLTSPDVRKRFDADVLLHISRAVASLAGRALPSP